ncbi:MAG: hypothetical protein J5I93_16230 [Pirellulaceae bacterium]|nr:hypothetical protein [Pirellulaceae bacterium]
MRLHLTVLLLCMCPIAALGNDGDETLRALLGKSDVVVLGEFKFQLVGEIVESGVVHYQGDFKIKQLIKGTEQGDRRIGGTIKVTVARFENEPADRVPELRLNATSILFLNCSQGQGKPTYMTSDVWLGVQPSSSALAKSLSRLVKEPPRQAAVAGLTAENDRLEKEVESEASVARRQNQAARRKPNVQVRLDGNWRLFLPAGFEYQATLTAEKEDRYRLMPGGLVFGASYEVQGDYLVSRPSDDSGESGFKWKIQSPYMITLVEQPARLSGDYLGAVFVRHSPAAELRLQEEVSASELNSPPRKTKASRSAAK